MPNPSLPTTTVATDKVATWFHRLFAALLAAAFALEMFSLFAPVNLSGWPEAALLLSATASTMASLARRLPLQNVLLAAFGIALIGAATQALGVTTGIPFGPFIFGEAAGQQLFKILPWTLPLLWVVIVLNSRGVARLILRPWRKNKIYGVRLIGLTAVLIILFDVALEPFAARVKHYWIWLPTQFPVAWFGAPLVNFLSWGIVALLILLLVTPALINKQISKRSATDLHSLAVWLGGILFFAVGEAQNGLWPAVAVSAVIAAVTAVLAVRGARW